MDIGRWLDQFEDTWERKDIDSVLDLFTDEVVYYETPFERLEGEALREEWETVREQEDISIETKVFARDGDRFAVEWSLGYTKNGDRHHLEGVYLIRLNDGNRCREFRQYFMKR